MKFEVKNTGVKLLLILLFVVNTSWSQQNIIKDIGDFTTLKVYSGIQIELVKSDKQQLVISGEKAAAVKVKIAKNTLKITFSFLKKPAKNTAKAILYYNKDIPIIYLTEGASITAKDFSQQQVSISAKDDSFVNMHIEIKHLTVTVSNRSIIRLSGSAKNTAVTATTNGLFYGFDLKTSNISTVKAGLGGKIEIRAGETLDARVTFGGSIFYKGTPEVLNTKKVLSGIIEAKNK